MSRSTARPAADSVVQLELFGLADPSTSFRHRYRTLPSGQERCANCGTCWSFAWRAWQGLPVCGDCWGLTPPPAGHALRRRSTGREG